MWQSRRHSLTHDLWKVDTETGLYCCPRVVHDTNNGAFRDAFNDGTTIAAGPIENAGLDSVVDLSQHMRVRAWPSYFATDLQHCLPGWVSSSHKTVSGASNISFAFRYWHTQSFSLDDVKLAELSNSSFKRKNVTFLGKTYSDPPYIFSGVKPPTPRIYAPAGGLENDGRKSGENKQKPSSNTAVHQA